MQNQDQFTKTSRISHRTKQGLTDTPSLASRKVPLSTTVVVAIISLVLGGTIGFSSPQLIKSFGPYLGMKTSTSALDFSSLQPVYDRLSTEFDGDLDPEALITGAKRGLVQASKDKYTSYMTRAEYDDFNQELHGDVGAGIGVEMGERGGYTKVLRTTPNNPAEKAGIKAGDIIYKVNDTVVYEKTPEEIAKLVRGKEGTELKLSVVRAAKELSFTLKREKINNVSAFVDYRDDTAIISIRRFDNDTGALVEKAAKEAKAKNVKKVILDLRGNGGGYVTAAEDVLSLWIDGKVVLKQKAKNSSYNDSNYARSGQAILAGTKTVVLIDENSASASEIVAGALKDYKKAKLIGKKSYGKGSMQSLFCFNSDDCLKVTIAKWYTPLGNNINKTGIKPDQEVDRSFEQINKDEDPQLDAALAE